MLVSPYKIIEIDLHGSSISSIHRKAAVLGPQCHCGQAPPQARGARFIMLRAATLAAMLGSLLAATPPGPGPFVQDVMQQPVPGATVFPNAKVCDVSKLPYAAAHGSNATAVLAKAIVDCGDHPDGGVVVVPAGMVLYTASLFMRSNLTRPPRPRGR